MRGNRPAVITGNIKMRNSHFWWLNHRHLWIHKQLTLKAAWACAEARARLFLHLLINPNHQNLIKEKLVIKTAQMENVCMAQYVSQLLEFKSTESTERVCRLSGLSWKYAFYMAINTWLLSHSRAAWGGFKDSSIVCISGKYLNLLPHFSPPTYADKGDKMITL